MNEAGLNAHILGDDATIVANASSTGRSAVSVIRISGRRAIEIAASVASPMPTLARQVTRCDLRGEDDELLDDALVWYFQAPHSYTGEDVVEISVHGGLVVPDSVVRALIARGARQATPGEFTRRALLNGKLDLLQAEAVADLIDARNTAAQRQSLQQLDGGLSRQLAHLRNRVLELEALLAYDIDFPEEDDGPIPRERVLGVARALVTELEHVAGTSPRGELIRDGALVVLAGAPNVGKSSLFNALLGISRAIVTNVAGTTRDAIEATLDLPTYPIRLVDTAGLRETNDEIELLGIETTQRYLEEAAVVLACVSPETADETIAVLQQHTRAPVIITGTKADLVTTGYKIAPDLLVSATDRTGLKELLERIGAILEERYGGADITQPALTRARHRALVGTALREVSEFVDVWGANQLPAPVAATHIRAAADALGEMIGMIHVDDVLDVVFRSFCVGK